MRPSAASHQRPLSQPSQGDQAGRSRALAVIRWLRRGETGQNLVEFALALPLFLVLLLGAIDFGWAFRVHMAATNAAREGARLGATGATDSAIISQTINASSGLLSASDVSVSWPEGNDSGKPVVVSVSHSYHYITPIGGLLSAFSLGTLPDPLPVTASASMWVE